LKNNVSVNDTQKFNSCIKRTQYTTPQNQAVNPYPANVENMVSS